jgi:hypothetical protein
MQLEQDFINHSRCAALPIQKTATIWHNNGNNNNLKGAKTPVIAQ